MLAAGVEIRGYRIERLLGRGGMGEVYEATQMELGRRVAFKILHSGLIDDEDFRNRFRREGRLQAALEHPHVVTVYEAGELEDGLFLAMRLVDGSNLKELIGDEGIDVGRTLRILAPVAEALDAAHENDLVHRDVKPQNILVGRNDYPFLADFGLTRGRDQTAFTRSGQMVGTVDYISPEQVTGESAGPASDIYALTGVLYECLTGAVPYEMTSDAAVLYAHVHTDPPSVTAVRDDLPAGLDQVVARGMAKDPLTRPATAGELIAAAAATGSETITADRPPPRRRAATKVSGGGTTVVADRPPPGGQQTAATAVRGGRKLPALLLGLLAVVILGIVGLIVGNAAGGKDEDSLSTAVAGPTVSLRAPGSWEPATGAGEPAIPGLDLNGPIGATPAAADGSGVVAGTTDAQGSRLLPISLVERVEGSLPTPDAVKLGKLEALRYRNVKVRGFDRDLNLYAAPSTVGVATLACYSVPGDQHMEGICESVAGTLALTKGKPYPLVTPADTEKEIDDAISAVSMGRENGRRQLAQAKTPAAQAAAAERLSTTYAHAARQLGEVDVSPVLGGKVDATRSALTASAAAYSKLAKATRNDEAEEFHSAAKAVDRSEADLETALASLGEAE
jgi:serine/threonine-protein kinase